MATEQVNYTATTPNGRTTYVADLTLTYDTPSTNKDGSFEVTSLTGTYTVTETFGHGAAATTSTTTYDSISLEKVRRFGDNDNRVYLDGTSNRVDRHGITFLVDEKTTTRPNRPEVRVNLFYNPKTKTISQFTDGKTAETGLPLTASTALVSEADTPAAVTCYVTGTRIATARGEVAVEALVVGDLVVTASGALRALRWLGHRDVDCRRHPRRDAVLPIRIAAHAFGANCPSRDLYVSPGHSILVDVMGEALVPAGALVNGTTVAQVEVASVTYWHVELDSHDVILAENLPAESYLDMGNRHFFAESGIVSLAAIPDATIVTHADFCRPFHADGPLVEAVRARLTTRAAQVRRRAEAA